MTGMKRHVVAVAWAVLLGVAPAAAQQPSAAEPAPRSEPRVERTIIEDDGARIEELRVRGQLQQVVVTPKGGAKRYQILTEDGGRPVRDGAGPARAGQRVWNVLSF